MTHVFYIHILTNCHKTYTGHETIAQRAEDEISSNPRVDTRQDLIHRWKARPRWLNSSIRACLPQALPFCPVNGQLSGWILVWALLGKCLFRMAVCASKDYEFNAEKINQICSNKRLDDKGPVRLLQQSLVRHLTGNDMASKHATDTK